MKYFKIKVSTNVEEIGKNYPQVCKFENSSEYDRDSPMSIYNIGVWDDISIDLLIPNYTLEYFSKKTDLLSVAVQNPNIFLLLSSDLFELIHKKKTPPYHAYKTKVFSRKKPLDYYLFHMPPMPIHFTDLEESRVKYDMFRMARPVTGYFVSQTFMEEYEEQGMTGIEFIPFEKVKKDMIDNIIK